MTFKVWTVLLVVSIIGCKKNDVPTADQIYSGGTFITMDESFPSAEAIAVKDGEILAVGDLTDIEKYQSSQTQLVDLKGKTMLPGFIDAHSHVSMAMKTIRFADLNAPPVGDVTNIAELINALKAHQIEHDVQADEWVRGWGYDPDQLAEGRHPNVQELSAAFPDNPVFLLHVSGHMAVVNDAAFSKAGITNETPSPANGQIVKERVTNELTGLLQEMAMYLILPIMPQPEIAEMEELFAEVQMHYARNGITTAQDGFTDYKTYQFLKGMADADQLMIDVEVLAGFRDAESFLENESFGTSINGLRLAGMKIVSDGSPQGKTAYFRKPYKTEVPGCAHSCTGIPTIEQSKMKALMAVNYQKDIQTYVHANGDGAIELLLDTHEEIVDSLSLDISGQRTVVIHSQFVGMDQLQRYKEYEFIPSFFTNHAFFWGDVHQVNLGAERAAFLSPMKSSSSMDIIATNHTDFTITPINQMFLTWTAVNRLTRSNQILGPGERLTPLEALKAITINSAYQHRIEDQKGSLTVGKIADFVILDQNPLTIAPNSIKDIKVLQTIKEGVVIFDDAHN